MDTTTPTTTPTAISAPVGSRPPGSHAEPPARRSVWRMTTLALAVAFLGAAGLVGWGAVDVATDGGLDRTTLGRVTQATFEEGTFVGRAGRSADRCLYTASYTVGKTVRTAHGYRTGECLKVVDGTITVYYQASDPAHASVGSPPIEYGITALVLGVPAALATGLVLAFSVAHRPRRRPEHP